jgi:hypothetical protein
LKKSIVASICAAVVLAALVSGCVSTAGSGIVPQADARRSYSVPLQQVTKSSKPFHLMRVEQLKPIPPTASIGVLSGGTLGLFLEADLESKAFTVRQVDVYGMMSPVQKSMTDPKSDFAFINKISQSAYAPTFLDALARNETKTEALDLPALLDRLDTVDNLVIENQQAEHYLTLLATLKKVVATLGVDYIAVAGPVYQELSYAIKIYDTKTYDLVYTAMFVGDLTEWRKQVGAPVKGPTLSYDFNANEEPTAFWEMAFSKYATDRINKK